MEERTDVDGIFKNPLRIFPEKKMKRIILTAIISVMVCGAVVFSAEEDKSILEQIGVKRGICVLAGDRDCRNAVKLAHKSELLIYVQLAGKEEVERAREAAANAGLYGRRIFVEKGELKKLHLADNVADVVAAVKGSKVSEKEALRVLRPGGKAVLGSKVLTKPFPKGVDEWSHPHHGPDNNPQSRDEIALAPYLTQFFAEPWYCPMPQVTVTSNGRVFKAFGNRAFKRPQWPMLNMLIAMNAYNGTILWKRKLDPDFMIHRNTMIATPETLYLADAVSCKLFDTATGKLKDEIKVPAGVGDGPVWKWMALKDGVLYAMVGEKEPPGDALRGEDFRGAGWPWWKIPEYEWGFGRTILAMDLSSREILWQHREEEPVDTRAMCMNDRQIFFYSLGKMLGCLDAKTGKVMWRTDDAKIVEGIAAQRPAQRAVWGFASTAYAKCSDDAVYFAGPQQTKLIAVSARDGSLLWENAEEGNFQLVLREEGLYAMGSDHASCKFEPLSGKRLLEIPRRAACTRATGSLDRIFVRGFGTRSWNVAEEKWLHISPMRPDCHDGVIVGEGHLYFGPWLCGCNLSLIGVICLGPAGEFDFSAKAVESERLEAGGEDLMRAAALSQTDEDWPAYRRDNRLSTRSGQKVATKAELQWEYVPRASNVSTAPVSVGGLVFVGGSDGVVRALDERNGRLKWKAFTGGEIRVSPSIWNGRAYVGSADGWLYVFEAGSGRVLWRFRAAPVERKIPVYGAISSNWPVASGVVVEDGVTYAAAGIGNYDGTHVYALDAVSGKIRWQNNTSGDTTGGQGAGVSVQGDMLIYDKKLYLAGGNRITLASYDLTDGKFEQAKATKFGIARGGPRGHELFVRKDGSIAVSGRLPWYTRVEDVHYVESAELESSAGTISIATTGLGLLGPGSGSSGEALPLWMSEPFQENIAVAVAKNAVVVAGVNRSVKKGEAAYEESYGVAALDINSGKVLWRHSLAAGAVHWGLVIDREGRVLVGLQDGRVLCYGPAKRESI